MKVLIIDNADPKDSWYNRPLAAAVRAIKGCKVTVLNHQEIAQDPNLTNSFDAIILSGVPLDYDFSVLDARQQELGWLQFTDKAVLGMCAGHQSIGMQFGARVYELPTPEAGLRSLRIYRSRSHDPIFSDLPTSVEIKAFHRGAISAPADFKVLASTKTSAGKYTNQIMRHTEKSIYGCQFHPEDSISGRLFLRNFIAIAKAQMLPKPALHTAAIQLFESSKALVNLAADNEVAEQLATSVVEGQLDSDNSNSFPVA